jgi:putative copper export protein
VTLYLASVYVHIVAACVWVGGMVFFALVAVPLLRSPEYKAEAPALVRWMGLRFRAVAWAVIGVLVVTGVVNLMTRGVSMDDLATRVFWTSPFGRTLRHKLEIVTVVLLLSVAHDFWIGPRASQTGDAKLRRAASWIARVNLVLALAVIAFAVGLVRGC